MKHAGGYFVDPWTDELIECSGWGSCWVVVAPDGTERTLDWFSFYALVDDLGRIEWFGGSGCGMVREQYGGSIHVRIAARSAGQAIRAAHSVLIFKADPRRLEEW